MAAGGELSLEDRKKTFLIDPALVSRYENEGWALAALVSVFGGCDLATGAWPENARSMWIDESDLGTYDAYAVRAKPSVHQHNFDFAVNLHGATPDRPAVVVEIQGIQHALSNQRKEKDAIKMAWAVEHKDRVHYYTVDAFYWERHRAERKPKKLLLDPFMRRVDRIIALIVDAARTKGQLLPRPPLERRADRDE